MKPSTPLPLLPFMQDPTNPACVVTAAAGNCIAVCGGKPLPAHQHAAYIVHACNNLPRVIEALKYLVSKTEGYPQLQIEMDIPLATALLRELGES